MIQILTHTPLYVWAILAFLVWRGVVEMRDREIARRRLFVLPLAMLALSLHDIAVKFGFNVATLGPWAIGCAATLLLAWKCTPVRVTAGTAPGRLRVRGSVVPLVVMMAIFLTKYATSVLLALHPGAVHQQQAAICAVFGVFNGWFAGRLLGDVTAWRAAAVHIAAERMTENRGAAHPTAD